MNTRKVSRREFLRCSAVVAAPFIVPATAFGANERIGIAVIGPGRQGGGLLGSAGRSKDARIVAIADVNLPRARKAAEKYKAEVFKDYRKLLERKDVDAVITATPEHWRALTCIHACQAGKDVYAEKPMTLTIREGRLMVEATRKYGRVFQCGSQQRSQVQNDLGCRLVREGAIGKITKVIGYNYPSPWNCGLPAQKVPDELDWDLWCGPTEPVSFNADLYAPRAKPGWLSFRPYSGGEMTGWGAHGLDQIQCALGMDDFGPVEVWVEGEKFNPPTYTQPEAGTRGNKLCSTPIIHYRYANGVLLELSGDKTHGGGIFIGEKGTITIDRGRCVSDPPELAAGPLEKAVQQARDQAMKMTASVSDPTAPASPLVGKKAEKEKSVPMLNGGHMQNWFDCIRSRKKPIADVEIGHRSATVCHLGNIARWTNRKLRWDPVKEVFSGDADANQYLDRARRKPYELPETI
ncbi:MAG: Gfo/Idh/MocA family oxidoreductase [Verrucomicrobia bacterium]|nr:Gfo/Idh/MocA family oxidoreductase [Verrucomicrobiota bacterium]